MDVTRPLDLFDALVIGGGPAGLSAAVNLARACRSVAVVDCGRPGRSDWAQTNRNYLGFPDGITAVELSALGRAQAEHYGVRFYDAEVARLVHDDAVFTAEAPGDLTLHGRAVVLATGVNDRWVTFPDYEQYVGRTMHWCIVCDGYEMQGKRVLVVGNDDHAAETAIQLRHFTDQVVMLTNGGSLGLSPEQVSRSTSTAFALWLAASPARGHGRRASSRRCSWRGGEIELDHLFNQQGADPNSALARALGVKLTDQGYIVVDTEAKTSLPGVYAAGDVTRLFSHQVATAVHEGGTAATALNYYLYQKDLEAFRAGRGQTSS